MNKRIGIITTSNAMNYGAVLQAYALRTCINSLDSDVETQIINYCGNESINGRLMYRDSKALKSIIYNLIIFFNGKYKRNRKTLYDKFDRFKSEQLSIKTPSLKTKKDVESVLNNYDTLICGSDQIWNLNLFDDDVFFLKFESNYPNLSYYAYSASIAEKMSDTQEATIVSRIKHFDSISIREKRSAEYLRELTKMEIESTLDPVYLLSTGEWDEIIESEKSSIDVPYALIFMIGHNSADQIIIDKLCEKDSIKKVIIHLHPVKYIKGDVYVSDASPEQFVSLIKEAEFIITDSFHATSFSIIYNKEFYTLRRGKRNSRIENLYEIFDVPDRYVDAEKTLNRSCIDYELVNQNINYWKKKSIDYLKRIVEE